MEVQKYRYSYSEALIFHPTFSQFTRLRSAVVDIDTNPLLQVKQKSHFQKKQRTKQPKLLKNILPGKTVHMFL